MEVSAFFSFGERNENLDHPNVCVKCNAPLKCLAVILVIYKRRVGKKTESFKAITHWERHKSTIRKCEKFRGELNPPVIFT